MIIIRTIPALFICFFLKYILTVAVSGSCLFCGRCISFFLYAFTDKIFHKYGFFHILKMELSVGRQGSRVIYYRKYTK